MLAHGDGQLEPVVGLAVDEEMPSGAKETFVAKQEHWKADAAKEKPK